MARRRHRRGHGEHVNHERWLVSYADFITLLFAFFTTLYAISTVDQKKAGRLMYSMRTAFNLELISGLLGPPAPQQSVVPSVIPRPETPPSAPTAPPAAIPRASVLGRLEQRFSSLGKNPLLAGKMQVRLEKRGLVISLAEAGFFDSGSASVRHDALTALARVADEFAGEPVNIMVEGHTDDVPVRGGAFKTNWELSTARATAVIEFLVEEAHVPAARLSAAGYGEHKPVAKNDTPEGRARNRRVDIVLDPESDHE